MTPKFILTSVITFLLSSAFAQDNSNLITTMRIGPFKLKSKQSEIETAVKTQLQFVKSTQPDAYFDTAFVTYNNVKYQLVFTAEYDENNPNPPKKLYSVSSSNTDLKTKSNIGIGGNKSQILLAYDKMDISIYNDFFYKDKKNPKDKIQYIHVKDNDSYTQIVFTTVDRVVTEVAVTNIEEGD